MKRYLVFTGWRHYPRGGWGDLAGNVNTKEEAESLCIPEVPDVDYWWHIVDTLTGTITAGDNFSLHPYNWAKNVFEGNPNFKAD